MIDALDLFWDGYPAAEGLVVSGGHDPRTNGLWIGVTDLEEAGELVGKFEADTGVRVSSVRYHEPVMATVGSLPQVEELVLLRRAATDEETARLYSSTPLSCVDVGAFIWDYGAGAAPMGSALDALEAAIAEINEDALEDVGLVELLPSGGWTELTTPSGSSYFVYPDRNWAAVIRASEIGPSKAVICEPLD